MGRGRNGNRNKKGKQSSDGSNGMSSDLLPEDYTVASKASSATSYFGFNNAVEAGDDYDDNHDEMEELEGVNDAMEEALIDSLKDLSFVTTEKVAKVRERVFRRAYKCLTCCATSYEAREVIVSEQYLDVIIKSCIWGVLRSSKSVEQYAACRCLEATSMLLGPCRDDYCEEIDHNLFKAVKATGKDPAVRGAALRSVAMTAFVCGTDESATHAIMSLCEEIISSSCVTNDGNSCGKWRGDFVPSHLTSTALECWALLATTIDDCEVASGDGRGVSILLPLLLTCLESGDTDMRNAAGECVALIHESRLNLGVSTSGEGNDESMSKQNTTQRRYMRGSWEGTEWEDIISELQQRIEDLSVESGHHMSKKAKKEQRATFREIVATVVDDEPPTHSISFRGSDITLCSWREIIQLNFVRHCLQSGFQSQLMMNPTLHQIFDADGSALSEIINMSQLEKRLFKSKTSTASKARDKVMMKKRLSRNNQKNLFLTTDGEDI